MSEYQGDYYGWLNTQAQAIEEGRFDQIDAAQVAEELRDMGKSEKRSIESYYKRILVHLLKIRYQPGKHTRTWDLSIRESRLELKKLLAENPSLRAQAEEFLRDAYETARYVAARQTAIALDVFPDECPFTIEDVTERDWSGPETVYEKMSRLRR